VVAREGERVNGTEWKWSGFEVKTKSESPGTGSLPCLLCSDQTKQQKFRWKF